MGSSAAVEMLNDVKLFLIVLLVTYLFLSSSLEVRDYHTHLQHLVRILIQNL